MMARVISAIVPLIISSFSPIALGVQNTNAQIVDITKQQLPQIPNKEPKPVHPNRTHRNFLPLWKYCECNDPEMLIGSTISPEAINPEMIIPRHMPEKIEPDGMIIPCPDPNKSPNFKDKAEVRSS